MSTNLKVKTDDVEENKSNLKTDIDKLKANNNKFKGYLYSATSKNVWYGRDANIFKNDVDAMFKNMTMVVSALTDLYIIYQHIYSDFNNFK